VLEPKVFSHGRSAWFGVAGALAIIAVSTTVRLVSNLSHQMMPHVRAHVGLESTILAPVQDPLRHPMTATSGSLAYRRHR